MEIARILVFHSSTQLGAAFPWAVLQSLCGYLMKTAGAWPWSSPAKLHSTLGQYGTFFLTDTAPTHRARDRSQHEEASAEMNVWCQG